MTRVISGMCTKKKGESALPMTTHLASYTLAAIVWMLGPSIPTHDRCTPSRFGAPGHELDGSFAARSIDAPSKAWRPLKAHTSEARLGTACVPQMQQTPWERCSSMA